ncbi:3-isopropylmalate dehydratase [Mycobacterium sp. 21AC1]|uniref:LeuD/DmdB family oxidoreductase small subunit n=1 Tax=[Mycobacterium] appelbergii TaxID=2939269 RepID=UPI002939219D|nr:3-isopropylmalate dehydratase [Mycobacterium sp. 21AC1]MDV3130220.1 3-isopropylmalate dehydratase [Mycobacterium sp. 21AC1]
MTTATNELVLSGRSWVFGDQVTTDEMFPGYAMRLPIAEAAHEMFNASRPGWPELVQSGDIVVGGTNFGLGSSRPVALLFRELGVSCLVAESFNSLFLRNCINYGLPLLVVPGVSSAVTEGDELTVDVVNATFKNRSTGAVLTESKPYPEFLIEILRRGGLLRRLEEDGYLRPGSTD